MILPTVFANLAQSTPQSLPTLLTAHLLTGVTQLVSMLVNVTQANALLITLDVLSLKFARPTSPAQQSHAHKTATADLCFAMEPPPAPAASPALLTLHALVTATIADLMVRAPQPNLALLKLRSPSAPRPNIASSLLVKPPELVEPAMLLLHLVLPTMETIILAKPITLVSLTDAQLILIASLLPSIATSTTVSAKLSIALKRTR